MATLDTLVEYTSGLVAQPTPIKILVTLGILLVGYLVGRMVSGTVRRLAARRREGERDVFQNESTLDKSIEYMIAILTIGVALVYLNASATSTLYSKLSLYVPSVLTALLTFTLGVMIVKLVMNTLQGAIKTFGFVQYARDLGFSENLVDIFVRVLTLFLYLVVLEISIVQLGISTQLISTTLTAASYGFVIVIGLLAFYGFRDLVQNYAAGIYLRGSDVLKPGKRVKIDDESGEVRDISTFGTTIDTDSGYFMLAPNKELMDRDILFKRVKADIETLEDMKNYFVAQEPSYCGPASAEMALSMFGYDISQNEMAEATGTTQPGGVTPEPLMDGIEKKTNGEVRTAFIKYSNITDVTEEFKTWFNDGALIIVNFDKQKLFPSADAAHYSLSVGAEGDEVLIVDPSAHTMSGGVYYVEGKEMLEAMREWEGKEKGYIVLAPKGSTAHWRIKEGLIYSDKSVYDHLSKSLELQLGKILRQGRILKHVTPEPVDDYLAKWRKEDRVQRLWTADRPEDNGGERKLDEFTDTDE